MELIKRKEIKMNDNLIGKRVIEKDVEFPRKGKVVFETDLNVKIRFYMGGSLETTKEAFKDFFEILTGFEALAPGDVVINSGGAECSCIQVVGDLYWVRNLNGDVRNCPFSIQYDKAKGYKIKDQEKEEKPTWHDITPEEFLKYWNKEVWFRDQGENWDTGILLGFDVNDKDFPYDIKNKKGSFRWFKHASITDPNA